jgi:hypothetical protein
VTQDIRITGTALPIVAICDKQPQKPLDENPIDPKQLDHMVLVKGLIVLHENTDLLFLWFSNARRDRLRRYSPDIQEPKPPGAVSNLMFIEDLLNDKSAEADQETIPNSPAAVALIAIWRGFLARIPHSSPA